MRQGRSRSLKTFWCRSSSKKWLLLDQWHLSFSFRGWTTQDWAQIHHLLSMTRSSRHMILVHWDSVHLHLLVPSFHLTLVNRALKMPYLVCRTNLGLLTLSWRRTVNKPWSPWSESTSLSASVVWLSCSRCSTNGEALPRCASAKLGAHNSPIGRPT